jgi:hypothetical protein
VFVIALAIYPTLHTPEMAQNPFYAVDQQVMEFEQAINEEDETLLLRDYTF